MTMALTAGGGALVPLAGLHEGEWYPLAALFTASCGWASSDRGQGGGEGLWNREPNAEARRTGMTCTCTYLDLGRLV